ncbi:ferric reductase-like transmembrane domain-containing protein [Actinospica sp. MGRD01-02]|uniref:Ferric reductase-like transmembrane domain-containing protein n=1 Tax=Actinospica acidithermotolerans TaxID=2828514 RepID=A0A941IJ17_9ACTN|nr:ferredoxin reductase family protein [Actinospica acidithermotolerans]MBR7825311.1 ferric reductase-like transmembrane domain-containing protein [Actinospica acidithermotolerans]
MRTYPNPHAKSDMEREASRPMLSRYALSVVLIVLVLGGGLEMLALWWLQTPAARVANLSEELIMAAQLTGLVGGYLLLIEVALMARLPWLERRIGSWLASLHRYLGGYLMMLLTMHVALVLTGYSLSLGAPVSTVLMGVLQTYPDVLIATIAYLLLLGLGLSSIKKFRRKLGYERWHAVHLVAYPAGVLAFGHEIAMGAQFTRNAFARDGWTLVNLAVAAAVLTHRFYLPLKRHVRHRLKISHIVAEAPDTISIYITGVDIDELNAQGGQYFRWRFLARGVWFQTHPFSLSAHPTENTLRLTVKGVGAYTRRLKRRLRPGQRVLADGPYGAFTAYLRRRRRVLLIGGGVGVTPLRAIAETLDGNERDVIFAQRASTEHDLLMVDELRRMQRQGKLTFLPVLGKRGKNPRDDPMHPARLREAIPDLREREVFICGSPGMVAATIKNLRRAGVRRTYIHSELFDF